MRRLFLLMLLAVSTSVVSTASAQVTKLIVNSPTGDYIGQGLNYTVNPSDGVFNATTNFNNGVTVTVHNADYTMWWQIDFAAINHAALAAGTYENCVRFPDPYGMTHNQVQVSTTGRGCNQLSGRFVIKELTWSSPIQVATFWATLEQSCEGFMPPLKLEVMYNMDAQTPTMTRSWGALKSIYR